MADHDYEDLSEKTIDEIKETVKEEDLDLRKLLKAEKNNKDRKTLKEWLNTKIDDQDEWKKDKKKAEKEESKRTKKKEQRKRKEAKEHRHTTGGSMWKRPKTVFLIGLVIGLALGASALYTSNMSGGQATVSPQQAVSQTDAYFTEQLGGTSTNISVSNVDSSTYTDLYVLTMDVQTGNRSLQRNVYLSKQSGLLFVNTLVGGTPPIDVESGQPVGTQGQTQGSQ